MKLSAEQRHIISSQGNIKINAVAGSGKTTTLIAYAQSRPVGSRVLYLAFNKSVKVEAAQRFAAIGLHDVTVETAHSLAYKYVMSRNRYQLRSQSYKPYEIAHLLNLTDTFDRQTAYVLATHISKLTALFCNSNQAKVQAIDYLSTVTDLEAKSFLHEHLQTIVAQTRLLLGQMDKGTIDITHDFYLKKFQLAAPSLPYDYILFDEGQDASPAMLDVFMQQPATKVIVGDTHQQIYGWRQAVNSIEQVSFTPYQLSASFRFGPEIAQLANQVVSRKKKLQITAPTPILGLGQPNNIKHKAIIARTNVRLLTKAIDYVLVKKNIQKLYFEGHLNSYTYAEDGASLYDILALYQGKRHLIKDQLIGTMRNVQELEDYINLTGDKELNMMLDLVKKHKHELPTILSRIKEMHVPNEERHLADIVFSTAHRAKGMEYDAVMVLNDFMTEEKLDKTLDENPDLASIKGSLCEEINLLYVAITRAKYSLQIDEELVPKGMASSKTIRLTSDRTNADYQAKSQFVKPQTTTIQTKEKQAQAYSSWTAALDKELRNKYRQNPDIHLLSAHFNRSKAATWLRIKKLGLDLE